MFLSAAKDSDKSAQACAGTRLLADALTVRETGVRVALFALPREHFLLSGACRRFFAAFMAAACAKAQTMRVSCTSTSPLRYFRKAVQEVRIFEIRR